MSGLVTKKWAGSIAAPTIFRTSLSESGIAAAELCTAPWRSRKRIASSHLVYQLSPTRQQGPRWRLGLNFCRLAHSEFGGRGKLHYLKAAEQRREAIILARG